MKYGEPWSNRTVDRSEMCVCDCKGRPMLSTFNVRESNRVVACVNALAGIPDPQAWVAAVRELETLLERERLELEGEHWLAGSEKILAALARLRAAEKGETDGN